MASAGKVSLVVATSMSAVEAFKDQLGLCRWNYALRNLNRQANPMARPSGQLQQVSTAAAAAAAAAVEQSNSKVSAAEEMTRRRRAEKAEAVMNLLCWGPN